MKKLNSLKLSEMAAENLSDREMKEIKGGRSCGCSCYWAGGGGSSTNDNCVANYYQGSGASSTSGSTQMICYYP